MPRVFAYRWGIKNDRWEDGAPSAEAALDELVLYAKKRFREPRGWTMGKEGSRAPQNAKQVGVGDIVLFCATTKFSDPGIYGIGRVSEPLPTAPDWNLHVEGLPICRELAKQPMLGFKKIFAPQGPAATVIEIENPPPAIRRLIKRATPVRPPGKKPAKIRGGTRVFDPAERPLRPRPGEITDPIERADALGKAVDGHHDLLVALHERLVAIGVNAGEIEEDRRGFDLRACGTIFEAKTTTDENSHQQIRLGLAQLLEYRLVHGPADAQLCLVVDRNIDGRSRRLLEALNIGCLALISGEWSSQARLYGVASRVALKPFIPPMPRKIRRTVFLDASQGIVVLATDLDRAEAIAFTLMIGRLRDLGGDDDILMLSGRNVPHHRGLAIWIAFSENVPPQLIDSVQSAIEAEGGEVEREFSVVERELVHLSPAGRWSRESGVERLVLEGRRAEFGARATVAPPLFDGLPGLEVPVRGYTIDAVVVAHG